MTPRQTRPRHQSGASSQPQPAAIQPSDYESDVYDVPPPTTRSNTELNLSVLRRHCASISTILSIAPSAQIYTYVGGSWNKTDIEGTLFLCQTGGGGGDGGEVGYVVVVLNRRGLENLVIDVGMIENVEVTEEFLMVGFAGEEEGGKVLGFYIHADRTETREVNCRLIREKWEEVRGAGERRGNGGGKVEGGVGMGRRLSLTELFSGGMV